MDELHSQGHQCAGVTSRGSAGLWVFISNLDDGSDERDVAERTQVRCWYPSSAIGLHELLLWRPEQVTQPETEISHAIKMIAHRTTQSYSWISSDKLINAFPAQLKKRHLHSRLDEDYWWPTEEPASLKLLLIRKEVWLKGTVHRSVTLISSSFGW